MTARINSTFLGLDLLPLVLIFVCHTTFLATDTQLCVLMLSYIQKSILNKANRCCIFIAHTELNIGFMIQTSVGRHAWFFKIVSVQMSVYAHACVACVCQPPKLLITSGVIDMYPICLVKQVVQLLCRSCSQYC